MKSTFFWLKLSVFNFFLLAILGVIMRYKIAFSFPFLDQKHLQEAHSHFAFYGWITQVIYIFIIEFLRKYIEKSQLKKYNKLLIINFIASSMMLVSFLYGGYFWFSILASTVALLTSFMFYFYLKKDTKSIDNFSKNWFLAGLFFAMLSSFGVFTLSFMMASKNIYQDVYLASQYFYLHFQYNGFFIFACLGFLMNSLKNINKNISKKEEKTIFWLMLFGCVVGYGLSVLWLKLPVYVFLFIVLASISQTFGAFKIFKLVKENWQNISKNFSTFERQLLFFSGFAFSVKILLQLGSNIPAVNQFAFGFRNVVIAYLHLVLLMCISVFLMSKIVHSSYFKLSKPLINSVKFLIVGILLNELMLGIMGIFSIKYISVPYSQYFLLLFSAMMMISLFFIFKNLKKSA